MGNRPGFALQTKLDEDPSLLEEIASVKWAGIDIEYCRAIAASALTSLEDSRDETDYLTFVDVGDTDSGLVSLSEGEIDVLVGVSNSLGHRAVRESTTGTGFTFTTPYFYFPSEGGYLLTTDELDGIKSSTGTGLSVVTHPHDWQWSAFVRWIVMSLIYAEKEGITQARGSDMPVVELFGMDFLQMFQNAVRVVGNYGEVYNRTLQEPYQIVRRGRNLLNVDRGPQLIGTM